MIAEVTQVAIDATYVMLLVSTIIPLLVGLLTKLNASSSLKSIVMIVLNAIAAFITTSTVDDGSAVLTKEGFIAFALGVVTSIATYYGVWKPVGVSAKLNESTAGFGLGKAA